MDASLEAAEQRLNERWEAGWAGLQPEEQEAIALFWLEGEVDNGGLPQFFSNSSGDLLPHALRGLERLGLDHLLVQTRSAAAAFGSDYPTDQSQRVDRLLELEAGLEDPDALFARETDAIQDRTDRPYEAALRDLARRYDLT